MSEAGVNASLDIDSGIDPGKLFTDAVLKLHVGVNDLASKIQQQYEQEQRRLQFIPNYVTLVQGTATAGTDLLDFGEPQPGRQWNIRLLTAGVTGLAANAAVITWYIGQRAVLLPDLMVWQFNGSPAFKDFSSNVMTVLPRQHLLAGITGGTGAPLAVAARFADLPVYNPLTQVDV